MENIKEESLLTSVMLSKKYLYSYFFYFTRLEWDTTNHTVSNVQGVETRISSFGGTESIECLDIFCAVPYMKSLVEFLVASGYERNKDLRGAPFDFRFSPG